MAERVWDKFLSEADREHVEVSGHTERGFGSRPALLMMTSTAGCSATVRSR